MLDPSTTVALVIAVLGIGALAWSDWHNRRARRRDATGNDETPQARR